MCLFVCGSKPMEQNYFRYKIIFFTDICVWCECICNFRTTPKIRHLLHPNQACKTLINTQFAELSVFSFVALLSGGIFCIKTKLNFISQQYINQQYVCKLFEKICSTLFNSRKCEKCIISFYFKTKLK